MRRAAKVDLNHVEILDALRAVGCSVQSLAQVGYGCPDALVGRAGQLWLIEIKGPRGSLTPDQRAWWESWRGPAPVVVRTAREALELVGATR